MEFRFHLDDLEIEEPTGWADFEISMKRDPKYHGIQFEASTGPLGFYGVAAEYLQEKKTQYGVRANVILIAELACDTEYEEVYRGRLNFGKYKAACGTDCRVYIPVEEDSCQVIFKSRFDQKVDIDSLTAFDGITVLPNYTHMGQEIELPAKALYVSTDGQVPEGGDTLNFQTAATTYIRPTYTATDNSIQTGQLEEPFSVYESNLIGGDPITPQLLFEDQINCFPGEFEYDLRMKGSYSTEDTDDGTLFLVKVKLITWDGDGDIFTDSTVIEEQTVFSGGDAPPWSGVFDVSFSGTIALPDGIGVYHILEMGILAEQEAPFIEVVFDSETRFKISATRLCPNTNTKFYLIHETLSRVTEAVTNRCIRVRSEYYGRIDSQPFAFDQDGCGGLRMLTSGLKIRRAPEDKFFASPKELLEGLNDIDNIGFSIEQDPEISSKNILRIEAVDHFYQDDEVLSHDAIPVADVELKEDQHFSKVLVGYKYWTVERVNGLGEFNSTREYRTSLETISNELDIESELVTGSYPIEITRQQSFADTGAADTKYDNNIFLICLTRNAYDFEVERDNIDNPANIFDPATVMNFRLSPVRNLMRWFKSIINSYVNLSDSASKLFFSAGTGNLTAEGELIQGAYDQACKLENMVIRENQDLFITHFERQEDAIPMWMPETITYEYPMSVSDYRRIREKPYGYINFQCGNGDFQKGYINEVKYRLSQGKATFILKLKWQ